MDQEQSLSGGAKLGYTALGFFLSLIGVLIAWLVNRDKVQQVKSDAIKFSLIGFGISAVAWIVLCVVFGLQGVWHTRFLILND